MISPWINRLGILTVLLALPVAESVRGQSDNQLVLMTPEFNVTTKDLEQYVKANIPEAQRERALAQESTVRDIFTNLYVVRAFASMAEANSEIDHELVRWRVDNYRDQMLMEQQLGLEVQKELDTVDWETLAEEHYRANQEKYKVHEQVNVDHILISTNEQSKDAALEVGKEVIGRLDAGESFADLAAEYSDDTANKDAGGNLGFFGRNQMVKPFEDAAFGISSVGEAVGPIETNYGYHILRLVERREERQMRFDEVRDRIMAEVRQRRRQEIRSEKIQDIRSGAVDIGLQINTDVLEEVEARYQGSNTAEE